MRPRQMGTLDRWNSGRCSGWCRDGTIETPPKGAFVAVGGGELYAGTPRS